MKLLTINGNPKTNKGNKQGYITGILHLQPNPEICPGASKECLKLCLNTAGRGQFNSIQLARKNKTQWFLNDRKGFMSQLCKDIDALIRKANREDKIPVVRLNGTSDINWMDIAAYTHEDSGNWWNIFDRYPSVQFYDYTKVFNRLVQSERYPNYHLTFSFNGYNKVECYDAMDMGFNVAVVCSKEFFNKSVESEVRVVGININGDEHDLRFLDQTCLERGVLVYLKAKGKALKASDNAFIFN